MPEWDGAITSTKYFDPNVDPYEQKIANNRKETVKRETP